jgi:hypothetical protein
MTFDDLTHRLTVVIQSKKTHMGYYRFAQRLIWLIPHLRDAADSTEESAQHTAGLRFYESRHGTWGSARNVLFQLQALARIYRKTHRGDLETFDRLKSDFKALEDALGRIDYFDELAAQAEELGAETAVVDHLRRRYTSELKTLTEYLLSSEWIQWDGAACGSPALGILLTDLEAVVWRRASKDRAKILKFFNKELQKVVTKSTDLDFENLEDGVHEFRRTARWISIYAQSLGGLMRLAGQDSLAADLSEYHTAVVVNAAYTKYPVDPREADCIDFDASLIYAFNWLISTIGDIKDDGQLEEALMISMVDAGIASEEEAHTRVSALVGSDRVTLEEIPERVAGLVRRFVDVHQVPQRLQETLAAQTS